MKQFSRSCHRLLSVAFLKLNGCVFEGNLITALALNKSRNLRCESIWSQGYIRQVKLAKCHASLDLFICTMVVSSLGMISSSCYSDFQTECCCMPVSWLSPMGFRKSSSSRRARSGVSMMTMNLMCYLWWSQILAPHLQALEHS